MGQHPDSDSELAFEPFFEDDSDDDEEDARLRQRDLATRSARTYKRELELMAQGELHSSNAHKLKNRESEWAVPLGVSLSEVLSSEVL